MSQSRLWIMGCVALGLALPSIAEADDASWVGKVVVTKRPGIKVNIIDESGHGAELTLSKIAYIVEGEDGSLIRVRERGIACRLAKSDVLLPEEAVNYFTAKIHDDSTDADAYGRRACARAMKGDLDIALQDYDEAIRLDPKSAEWRTRRGILYRKKGLIDKAIAEYTEAIRLDPQGDDAFFDRGNAWETKEDHSRALADFDAAVRLNPKEPDNLVFRPG